MDAEILKILLVEDNPGDARLVVEALKDSGEKHYEMSHVERFQDAVNKLNEEKFNLILLDLTLPDSQGVNTFSRMHTLFPKIPIVVLTGFDDETMAFDALQEGIEIYLIKDKVDSKLLMQALDYAIKKNKMISDLEN